LPSSRKHGFAVAQRWAGLSWTVRLLSYTNAYIR